MRAIGQIQQGFFPTPDRVVNALATILKPQGQLTCIVDPGCGEGAALGILHSQWKDKDIRLFGIESDQGRAKIASEVFLPTAGDCLWASIEDTGITGEFPLLWFNPPYDRTRNVGRLELLLFQKVKEWTQRSGILIFILPSYVLADPKLGLAMAIERDYQCLWVMKFPEPEFSQFKQVIVIAKRRERAKSKGSIEFPGWAKSEQEWPTLPDKWLGAPIIVPSSLQIPKMKRIALSRAATLEAVSRSTIRNSLLREAMSPAPSVERPLLPLREGHLALALAGGLCDGIIKHEDKEFLMKGSLESKVLLAKRTERTDGDGNKTADVEHWKTHYVMRVRCLRDNGEIEEYSSAEGEKEYEEATEDSE